MLSWTMTSQETEGVFTQLAGLSFPQEYTSDLTPELSVASQISLERRKSSPKGQIEVSPSEGIKDRMALNEFNPSPVPYSFFLVIVKNQTKPNTTNKITSERLLQPDPKASFCICCLKTDNPQNKISRFWQNHPLHLASDHSQMWQLFNYL